MDDWYDLGSMPPEAADAWIAGVLDGFALTHRLPDRQADFDQLVAVLIRDLQRRGARPEIVGEVQRGMKRLWGTRMARSRGV